MLYIALAACAALACVLVYRYDLYDREPWPVMLAVIVAGVVVMRIVGAIEPRAIAIAGGDSPSITQLALTASLCEELTRAVAVLLIALFAPKDFNDPMDGLVYGSAIGIGMALEESWGYVTQGGAGEAATVAAVELVRVFGHLLMGGVTGFGIGMIRRPATRRSWMPGALACVAAGVTFHFLWDLAALTGEDGGGSDPRPVYASVAIMLAGTLLYGALVVLGSGWSRAVFAPASTRRVWRR